ncbi:MAG: hypothetical protein ACPGN3_02890 [Opitutales bacterium]
MRALKFSSILSISFSLLGLANGQSGIENLKPFFQSTEDSPLHALIPTLTGYKVLRPTLEDIEPLKEAIQAALSELKAEEMNARRANEAGLQVEEVLIKHLRAHGFDAQIPKTQSGKRRSVGYPDIAFVKEGRAYYLEVKTFNARTAHSTMRTFYLSPSKDPKITRDASHLLVAFELEEPEADTYRAVSARLLDLYDLECGLKFEFNASNRDLYGNALELFELSEEP